MEDKIVVIRNDKKLVNKDFKNEKALQEYIVYNIERFCEDILEDEYVYHKEEMDLSKQLKLMPRGRRIDIYVQCKRDSYIVELKSPKYISGVRTGIGQLLDYGRTLHKENPKLVLISTKHDMNTSKTIEHYKLPIRYYYMTKDCTMEYKGEYNDC